MLLRYFWIWCSGFAAALGVFGLSKGDWVAVAVGFGGAVAAAVVVRRGLFGTAEEAVCCHSNRVQDGTAQYRRARLALVREDE